MKCNSRPKGQHEKIKTIEQFGKGIICNEVLEVVHDCIDLYQVIVPGPGHRRGTGRIIMGRSIFDRLSKIMKTLTQSLKRKVYN